MTQLTLTNVSAHIGPIALLDDITLAIEPGQLVALIGPNGAGKSSLLKAAIGQLDLSAGQVELDAVSINALSPLARARKISYLPQQRALAWPITVRGVVALGRFAFAGQFGAASASDSAIIDQTIAACDLVDLQHRTTDTLSGGELARMHCARAFVAQTPLLLGDEPVAALDPAHGLTIMSLLRDYVRHGNGALIVLHDLNLAAQFADRLVWMQAAKIVADGSVEKTMTPEQIGQVFNVSASVEMKDDQRQVVILPPE